MTGDQVADITAIATALRAINDRLEAALKARRRPGRDEQRPNRSN